MSERELHPFTEKLVTAVAIDYPAAGEIVVSFPEQWQLVGKLNDHDPALYIAGLPPKRERSQRDHFHGLSAEINETLTNYRMYKLYQPWPQPGLTVAFDEDAGTGRVVGGGDLKIRC